MKQVSLIIAALLMAVIFVQPIWARTCPKFIKEGKDLLAKSSLSDPARSRIKNLIDESERLHDSGDHEHSLAKIKEALALLKKK